MHIKYPHRFRKNARLMALSVLCLATSFAVGIQTAGEVQPVSLIEAGSIEQAGDVDGSGIVDIQDVISILEISQGYAVATPQQLKLDPNGDGQLTVDDALRLLSTFSL